MGKSLFGAIWAGSLYFQLRLIKNLLDYRNSQGGFKFVAYYLLSKSKVQTKSQRIELRQGIICV